MLKVLFVILSGLVFGEIVGYLIHRLIHWERMGFLFRRHMVHHLKLYPTTDFLSDQYRSPGKDNTMYVFTAFIAVACILMFIFAPVWIAAIYSVEFIILGLLNDYFHDAFHIRFHKLTKYEWFLNLRRLHFHHHEDMGKNFGIFSWLGDYIFRTFKDPAKD